MDETNETESVDQTGDESLLSRRQLIAGGLLAIGGNSQLLKATEGQFHQEESLSDSIHITDQPNLDYQIHDNTKNTNVQYDIDWQVEWVDEFDHIEIYVDNTDNDAYDSDASATESFTRTASEGTLSTGTFWGANSGQSSTTFEFIFEVYASNGRVIRKVVTDSAGGSGTGEGNFGSPDDPDIDSIEIIDNGNQSSADYEVTYFLSNGDNFNGYVQVEFNGPWSFASGSVRGDATSGSTVNFHRDGVSNVEYEITVEVRNESDLVVDSVGPITDKSDGVDTQWP